MGNLVSWRSKLQPLTAASTHAAELIAMSSCADESIWLRSLLLECGFVIPTIAGFYVMPTSKETPTDFRSYAPLVPPSPVYGGNLGSVFTSNNPETSGKTNILPCDSLSTVITSRKERFVSNTSTPSSTFQTFSPKLCFVLIL